MMTEQQMFEGQRCPVRQQFITPRDKWVAEQLRARENRMIDRQAGEAAFTDKHESGMYTL